MIKIPEEKLSAIARWEEKLANGKPTKEEHDDFLLDIESEAFENGQKAQHRGISNWIEEGNKNHYSRLVGICDCCGEFATDMLCNTCKNCI